MGKFTFTVCTPIPAFIPREIAVQALHDHSQVINTNPLVLEHKPISAPKEAAFDERNSAWYEIVERIQYVPGLGKMGSGKISFPGCFHDMPWGLQTHIHAPLSIDMRVQYRIAGEVAGVELQEPRELGLAGVGAPDKGLYLRTDAELKCNAMLSSFVKSQTKDATNAMVAQIVKNAERMDADILARMITDERLARNATIRAGRRGSSQPYPPMPSFPTQSQNPGQGAYTPQNDQAQQASYPPSPNYPPQSRYSGQGSYTLQDNQHQQASYPPSPAYPPQAGYAGQADQPLQAENVGYTDYQQHPDYVTQPDHPQQHGRTGSKGQNWI